MDRIKEIDISIDVKKRIVYNRNTPVLSYFDTDDSSEFVEILDYIIHDYKKCREALDKAHIQLDKYESIIDLDVIEENKRLREAIHYLKGSAYAVYLYALHTIRSKTEIDIDKVIDKTDDMCKFAQRALREES